jgi:hypothetical protein
MYFWNQKNNSCYKGQTGEIFPSSAKFARLSNCTKKAQLKYENRAQICCVYYIVAKRGRVHKNKLIVRKCLANFVVEGDRVLLTNHKKSTRFWKTFKPIICLKSTLATILSGNRRTIVVPWNNLISKYLNFMSV